MLLDALAASFDPAQLLTDSAALSEYGTDWTGRWNSRPVVVVQPRTTAEVQRLVGLCANYQVPIVIQGGNTSLVGGAVGGSEPHVLLSTRQLHDRVELDLQAGSLLVSAGFRLAEVHQLLVDTDWMYGVDVVSREWATIGGNISTNAGGIRVVAFGDTGANLLEVEAVTADGEGAWYPAKEWVGSEGGLGVITAARLRLQLKRSPRWTALLPNPQLLPLLEFAESVGPQVMAAEVFQGRHAAAVAEALELPKLDPSEWWLLLEGDQVPPQLPAGGRLLSSAADISAAWQYREYQTQLINTRERGLKLDSSVPRQQLPEFVSAVARAAESAGLDAAQVFVFGHLLVGNLHLAFVECDDFRAIEKAVIEEIIRLGGSIRAEHGVGQAKADYYQVPDWEARLRQRFDPLRIFNRGIAGK